MAQKAYQVEGMTCDHCVAAVTSEVTKVSGVNAVDVQLEGGVVTVTGEEFSDDDIRAAVDEAGYEMAGTR